MRPRNIRSQVIILRKRKRKHHVIQGSFPSPIQMETFACTKRLGFFQYGAHFIELYKHFNPYGIHM